MIRVVDEQAPFTVRAAAAIMAAGAVLTFLAWLFRAIGGVESMSHAALAVAVVLVVSWAVARLNGAAYVLAICSTFLGSFGVMRNMVFAAASRNSRAPFELTAADWISSAVMVGAFLMLLTPSSLRAPWGLTKGFSR